MSEKVHFYLTTYNEFQYFKDFVLNIETDYWEHKYASAKVKRKIPIPSMQSNLILMFNGQEINELKVLFNDTGKDIFEACLNVDEIDYTLILN